METNKKRHYEKPQLQEVKLVPEEAVLAACKTASGRGTTARSCSSSTRCSRRTSANGS